MGAVEERLSVRVWCGGRGYRCGIDRHWQYQLRPTRWDSVSPWLRTVLRTLVSYLKLDFLFRLVYGVYDNAARVNWSPTKIFADEINIVGSFSQTQVTHNVILFFLSWQTKQANRFPSPQPLLSASCGIPVSLYFIVCVALYLLICPSKIVIPAKFVPRVWWLWVSFVQ